MSRKYSQYESDVMEDLYEFRDDVCRGSRKPNPTKERNYARKPNERRSKKDFYEGRYFDNVE